MSADKKAIREKFRTDVFTRDKHACRMCGKKGNAASSFVRDHLDAHHITDRTLMPGGGYVKENGISLCFKCHELAEVFHSSGVAHPGYAPEDLYLKIGSSGAEARKASEKLVRKSSSGPS